MGGIFDVYMKSPVSQKILLTYSLHANKNSFNGYGGIDIDTDNTSPVGMTTTQCQQRCTDDPACDCVTYAPNGFNSAWGRCWKRKQCEPSKFNVGGGIFDVYMKRTTTTTTTTTTAAAFTSSRPASERNSDNENSVEQDVPLSGVLESTVVALALVIGAVIGAVIAVTVITWHRHNSNSGNSKTAKRMDSFDDLQGSKEIDVSSQKGNGSQKSKRMSERNTTDVVIQIETAPSMNVHKSDDDQGDQT